jgi:hypothetical protein
VHDHRAGRLAAAEEHRLALIQRRQLFFGLRRHVAGLIAEVFLALRAHLRIGGDDEACEQNSEGGGDGAVHASDSTIVGSATLRRPMR